MTEPTSRVKGTHHVGSIPKHVDQRIAEVVKEISIETGTRAEYHPAEDFSKSIDHAYSAIRERKSNGGEGWEPK